MKFTNEAVDIGILPKVEEVMLTPVDRQYLKVMLLHKMILWLIVLLAAAVTIGFYERLQSIGWIVGISMLLVTGIVVNVRLAYLSFLNKAFAVREHDIIYREGWLVKSLHVLPFNRIQHCSIDTGVIERWFGLSTLKIFTAGGNESDIGISGLTTEQSTAFRELIIQRNNLDE